MVTNLSDSLTAVSKTKVMFFAFGQVIQRYYVRFLCISVEVGAVHV